jgi:hypothetical protein
MSHVHANVRRVRHVHVCMCLCRCVTHKLYAITLRHVFGAYSTVWSVCTCCMEQNTEN